MAAGIDKRGASQREEQSAANETRNPLPSRENFFMKNIAALALALTACFASPIFAGNPAAVSRSAHAAIEREDAAACPVDPEIIQLPPCAVRHEGGRLQVIANQTAALTFNRYGLAAACLPESCWSYVNRRGWVIVRDVAVIDNGAGEFHHGLVRVTRDGKWGLSDTRGKRVVPLRYDGMLEFDPENGWLACSQCSEVHEDEHSWFEGGKWWRLNSQGKVIGRARIILPP